MRILKADFIQKASWTRQNCHPKFNPSWLNFCANFECRFNPKSALGPPKLPPKIQPNFVEFWVAILAGPGCFLDAACAFFADVVQVPSQKSAFNQIWLNFGWQFCQVQDAFGIRPGHCLLMLFRFQARNQPSKFAEIRL